MTRAQLEALAARVEAAQGADRALDREIAMTAMPPRRRGMYVRRHYTASLDAAASLEGAGWLVTIEKEPEGVTAMVLVPDGRRWKKYHGSASGEHAEARARTAANLRARAMEARDGE